MKATGKDQLKINDKIFSKHYVDFLSEAGWRLLGLVGGAILSKAIGGSYKVSQKTLRETQKITEKATKIY